MRERAGVVLLVVLIWSTGALLSLGGVVATLFDEFGRSDDASVVPQLVLFLALSFVSFMSMACIWIGWIKARKLDHDTETPDATSPAGVADGVGDENADLGPDIGNVDELRHFLRGRDVPCPGCAYNLRDGRGELCPECGLRLDPSMFEAPAFDARPLGLSFDVATPCKDHTPWWAITAACVTALSVLAFMSLLTTGLRTVHWPDPPWISGLGLFVVCISGSAAPFIAAIALARHQLRRVEHNDKGRDVVAWIAISLSLVGAVFAGVVIACA